MNKDSESSADSVNHAFSRRISAIESRKLAEKRKGVQSIWFGLGMFGLIGWTVAIPTLLGALLGAYFDRHYPGVHSWTLSLLIIGLFLGSLNAWRWIAREERVIRKEGSKKDE